MGVCSVAESLLGRQITQRNAGRYLKVARLPHCAGQSAGRNVGEMLH